MKLSIKIFCAFVLTLTFSGFTNAQTITLQPDTAGIDVIMSSTSNTSNYGTFTTLEAKRWTSGGVPFTLRGLVKFAGLSTIPIGSIVSSAVLTLGGVDHSPLTQSNACYLQRITQNWVEGTVTWNTQPTTTTTGQISTAQSTSATQDFALTVTSMVQKMIDSSSTNYGWMLRLQSEANYYTKVTFASSDYTTTPSKRPKLVVTYAPGYFRSKQTGNWNSASTWETSSDNVNWYNATTTPKYTANTITIQSAHTVTITATDTLDQTVVNGTLVYNGGTLRINNGTGIDLTVNGTLRDECSNAVVFASSATWALGSSSTFVKVSGSSCDPWRDGYDGGISAVNATANWMFRKTSATTPSIPGSMTYPNLIFENNYASATTWTIAYTGSAAHPAIKGDVNIGGSGTYNVELQHSNTNATKIKSEGGLIIKSGSTYGVYNNVGIEVQGNITINGTLDFSTYTGTLLLSGSNNQTVNGASQTWKTLTINKNIAAKTVTLNTPLTISSSLTLTKGKIISTSTNLVAFNNGATVSGASDSSFVSGFVKKTGNAAFVFPTGKSSNYQPISISAPSNTAAVYTAEYFNTGQSLGSGKDATIDSLSTCEYWTLNNVGTVYPVNVTLGWDSYSCNITTQKHMRLVKWNGSQWTDLGNSSSTTGIVTSSSVVNSFGYFTLAKKYCHYVGASAGRDTIVESGASVQLGINAVGGVTYSWSPTTGLSGSTLANPIVTRYNVSGSSNQTYTYIITATNGCSNRDTVSITIKPVFPCYTDELLAKNIDTDNTLYRQIHYEDSIFINLRNNNALRTQAADNVYIIPVVVHVIRGTTSPTNYSISDAQIDSQIRALNEAFQNGLTAPHGDFAVDTKIQFCLAQNMPNGSTTWASGKAGVMRDTSNALAIHNLTNCGGHTTGTSPNDYNNLLISQQFDPANYLNIFVVSNIVDSCLSAGTILGVSQYPFYSNAVLDAIVMDHRVFGDNSYGGGYALNTFPNTDKGRTLVHEVGHYLHLYHTFGNNIDTLANNTSCYGTTAAGADTLGDLISDTPPTSVTLGGCPYLINNTCSETYAPYTDALYSGSTYFGDVDVPDQIENFMDYSNDCKNTFTEGQKDRMYFTLNQNSQRVNLVSAANIVYTGVGSCPNILFTGFTIDNYQLCANTMSVNVEAASSNGTSYIWHFGDGDTASGMTASHTYTAAGNYNITLDIDSLTSAPQTVNVSNCTPIANNKSHWFFGNFGGLDFSTGIPVYDLSDYNAHSANPTSAGMYTDEGCTVINNDEGDLLFFGNSSGNLFNKNHDLISNTGTYASNSSTYFYNSQVISFPRPCSEKKQYYYFVPLNWPFTYKIVDIDTANIATVSASNSSLTFRNMPAALTGAGQQLIAVPHSNSKDFWIIMYGKAGNTTNNYDKSLLLFLATKDSISFHSQYYTAGSPAMIANWGGNVGQLKVSPDGTKLVCTGLNTFGALKAELFSFNNTTGAVSLLYNNFQAGGSPTFPYGASFSPNSKVLYLQTFNGVWQYNLQSGTPQTGYQVNNIITAYNNLQLGPDNKIYMTRNSQGTCLGCISDPSVNSSERKRLSVITMPDSVLTTAFGTECGYNYYGPLLKPQNSLYQIYSVNSLPNLIDFNDTLLTYPNPTPIIADAGLDKTFCTGATATIGTTAITNLTYSWTPSSDLSSDVIAQPDVTPTSSNDYIVSVSNEIGCVKNDTVEITLDNFLTVIASAQINASCNGTANGVANAIVNTIGTPTYDYLWDDGAGQTTATAYNLSAGTYIVTVHDGNKCTGTDTVTITQPTDTICPDFLIYDCNVFLDCNIFSDPNITDYYVQVDGYYSSTTPGTCSGTINTNGAPFPLTFTHGGDYTTPDDPVHNDCTGWWTSAEPYILGDHLNLTEDHSMTMDILNFPTYGVSSADYSFRLFVQYNNSGPFVQLGASDCVYLPYPSPCNDATSKISNPKMTDDVEPQKLISNPFQVNLYPSPANSELNIQVTENTTGNKVEVELYNAAGQKIGVFNYINTNQPINVNIAELTGGIYYCKINSVNNNAVKRFVIIK